MSGGVVGEVARLLAHAHAIEAEAADRYALLADQMEVHNNPEVAELFRKLADLEAKHAATVVYRAKWLGIELPALSPWDFAWPGAEPPECASIDAVHYRMTPHHALALALTAETRARDFFQRAAVAAEDEDVRALAIELADDEARHVRLIEEWLADVGEPKPGWADDPDPPLWQE